MILTSLAQAMTEKFDKEELTRIFTMYMKMEHGGPPQVKSRTTLERVSLAGKGL